MEESSIIFKKSLCVTSLSSETQQSSSKEALNRLEGRRHQSAVEKRQFISGLHSAETTIAEDAPACHIYKYMLKSIKSDFNWVLSSSVYNSFADDKSAWETGLLQGLEEKQGLLEAN